jgi:hypothetical protein
MREITDLFNVIASSKKEFSDSLVQTRPTWMNELQELEIVLIGREPDRYSNVKIIANIDIYAKITKS